MSPYSSDEATHSSSSFKSDAPPVAAVQALASTILWTGVKANRIHVENLNATYNDAYTCHTFSLSLHNDDENHGNGDAQKYVLRVPVGMRLISIVSILSFLQGHTHIPIAEVVHFDPSENNAVGSPYVIQKHLRGVKLSDVLFDMNPEQTSRLARELGDITRQLLAVKSSHAGYVEQKPGHANLGGDEVPQDFIFPFGRGFYSENNGPEAPYEEGPVAQSAHQLLKGLFDRQRDHAITRFGIIDPLSEHTLDDHRNMSWDLLEGNWLDNIDYCLAHLDLWPYRIWVNLEAEPGQPIITGITGWNASIVAPSFLCCAPPFWLWTEPSDFENSDADTDEDERLASRVPTTEENRELKALYGEATGPEYLRFAYGKPYQLARRLFMFAIKGMRANEDFYRSDAMLHAWDELPRQERINHQAIPYWGNIGLPQR